MTVANKVNALVILISIVAGCLLSATTILREYVVTRDGLVEQVSDAVLSQPQIQVAIYYRDRAEQDAVLAGLLNTSPAILYGFVRDPIGAPLQQLLPFGAPEFPPESFSHLRGTQSVAEQGLTSQHSTSPLGQ